VGVRFWCAKVIKKPVAGILEYAAALLLLKEHTKNLICQELGPMTLALALLFTFTLYRKIAAEK
jgi:hypothetical protein